MNQQGDYKLITNPAVELLAIKLYEHHHELGWFPRNAGSARSWMDLPEDHRERYRSMARGDIPLPEVKA